jgi:cytochrome b
METHSDKKEIVVWDRATRVFHWILVVMVAICWLTSEAEGVLFWAHLVSGYGILVLVLFRLAWGFLGNRHALFKGFVCGWLKVGDHAKALMTLILPRHIGHNPLGGWMILTLLTGLTLLVTTELFSADDGDAGPYAVLMSPNFNNILSEIHEELSSIFLILIGLHVMGVLVDSLLGRENLVRALWAGIKRVPAKEPEGDALESSVW